MRMNRAIAALLCAQVVSGADTHAEFTTNFQTKAAALNMRSAAVAYRGPGYTGAQYSSHGRVGVAADSAQTTPDTVYMIASISKVFTGTAVMSLVHRGLVNIDDDICDTIATEWGSIDGYREACQHPFFKDTKVTWRMLLTHRSSMKNGIASVEDADGNFVEAQYGPEGGYRDGTAAGNAQCPIDDVRGFYRDFMINKATETGVGSTLTLADGSKVDWYDVNFKDMNSGSWLSAQPGANQAYSNLATGYLAALVEMKAGTSFQADTHANIFAPLGMTSTAWHRRDLPSTIAEEAIPVHWSAASGAWTEFGHYCFVDFASGGLRTTARDLSRFADSMLAYGAGEGGIWSDAVGRQAMGCLEQDANGNAPAQCAYGACWEILDNSHKDTADEWLAPYKQYDWTGGVMHGGFEAGAATQLLILPVPKVYVAVLSNTDGNGEDAAQELAKHVGADMPAAQTVPLPPPTTSAPAVTPVPTMPATTLTPATPAPSGDVENGAIRAGASASAFLVAVAAVVLATL